MSLVLPRTIRLTVGTVLLFQDETNGPDTDNTDHPTVADLIKTKDGIVLSPQPHKDPNDPLVLPRNDRTRVDIELARLEKRFDVDCTRYTLSHRRWTNPHSSCW